MSRRQRFGIVVLALASACAFAVAGAGVPWWSTEEVSIGPTYSMRCFAGDCQRTSLDWVHDDRWMRFGVAAWAAGLVAAGCLVLLAGAVASGRAGRLAAKMTITAAAAATAAGAAFAATFPGEGGMTSGMRTSYGGFAHFAGVLLAIATAMVALRAARVTVSR